MTTKIQKLISFLIIIAIIMPVVLFSRPQKADAWLTGWISDFFAPPTAIATQVTGVTNTTQVALSLKEVAENIAKQVLMSLAKRALQQMTKSTINWINSGFHGSPLFVENPKSFFKDIAKSEIKTLVDTFGYDGRRFPFGRQFALNTIANYKSQLETNAEYTLSRVIDDPALLARYRNDFNFGGWNAFLINTQYPQNNYPGFQMLANEELARQLEGTSQNAAQKVNTVLAQGQGFLSPETCLDEGTKYNDVLANQFQRPSFKTPVVSDSEKNAIQACYDNSIGAESEAEVCVQRINAQYDARVNVAKTEWAKTNTCKNLVNTTPGSVVGDQIKTALGSGPRQLELAGAMGNSISAVLDALLSKFLGDGLNALSSKVNPQPAVDDWEYDGQRLGGPGDGTNNAWDSGPDEVIVLNDFKKTVEDGINNTNTELQLMENISSFLSQIWPQARLLDICLPGPDMGWQERMLKEMERNSKELQGKQSDSDGKKAAQADLAFKELKFAVDFFKDWINNKMMAGLPNAITYMDAVDEIETLSQQSDELTDAKRLKIQALARLQAIKIELDKITAQLNAIPAKPTQPIPGSSQERTLISLKKQYNAIGNAVSNTTSIENRKNELAIVKDKLTKLNELLTQCKIERQAKNLPAVATGAGNVATTFANSPEQNEFCNVPIKGGYDHEMFRHENDDPSRPVTHPEIPLVNANDVLKWRRIGGIFGNYTADIKMSCDIIYKANVLDYKGNLPGATPIIETYSEQPTDLGTCTYPDDESTEQNEGLAVSNMSEDNCLADSGTWTGGSNTTTPPPVTPPGTPPASPPTVLGSCGTSNGQTFSSAPTNNLCSTGTPSAVFSGSGSWIWNCNGSGIGGYGATCSANLAQVDGTCGAWSKVYPQGSTSWGPGSYCATGTPSSSPAFPGPLGTPAWRCNGLGNGTRSNVCNASIATEPASLSASPSSGIGALNNVTLTATNSDSGQFYYYFYCDRSQTDSPLPPVPSGNINPPLLIFSNTYTSPVSCNYGTGTHYPKVISWRVNDANGNNIGNNLGAWRQANTKITVQ